MSNKDTTLIAGAILGGLLGYSAGANKTKGWDEFIKKYVERLNHIAYIEIIIPIGCFEKIKSSREVYREGVTAYLLGLPNASLPMILRFLEIGLKQKYSDVEGKTPPNKLVDLINWSEKYLKDKTEIAHGFRILRNLIHKDKLVKEQDIPEAIRHVSAMLNILHPFTCVKLSNFCSFCSKQSDVTISRELYWVGNVMAIKCKHCKMVNNLQLIP